MIMIMVAACDSIVVHSIVFMLSQADNIWILQGSRAVPTTKVLQYAGIIYPSGEKMSYRMRLTDGETFRPVDHGWRQMNPSR